MSRLTVFLARFIGLFTIVLVAAFFVRGSAAIDATVADVPVMLFYAITSVAIGFAMILGHNVWSGGVLPVVVTLVGWLILVKGATLLFLPPDTLGHAFAQIESSVRFPFYLAPAFLIGLYLTWAGFTAPRAV